MRAGGEERARQGGGGARPGGSRPARGTAARACSGARRHTFASGIAGPALARIQLDISPRRPMPRWGYNESAMRRPRAVVLLSGGVDSTTTAAIALADGFDVHAMTFDYGQRHRLEIERARLVAQKLGLPDHIV